jgi:methylmalonyl-CoA/ethylmalonyl-CoA epimerase
MITRIDHIGIAVQNIQESLQFFQDALGMKLEGVELEEGGRTKIAFLPVGQSDVELVEPQDPDGGVARFLAKRGEGLHHICLEVDDIETALARLREHGAQLIDETPRVNAHGQRLAFIQPKSAHGVLIELYQGTHEDLGPRHLDLQSLRHAWDIQTESAREGAKEFLRALQHGSVHIHIE